MKKVLTFGVFDYFHLGHLRLFKNCKKFGDYLIVGVRNGENDNIHKIKPNSRVLYTTEQRKEILESIKEIDEVVVYNDVWPDIKNIDFDVYAVGGDQTHDAHVKAMAWAEQNGKEVVHIPRTEGICSTDIKKRLVEEELKQNEK
jgi:glycerol-3-phosphate cytidylyltransferase